jgi:hypothetical protein
MSKKYRSSFLWREGMKLYSFTFRKRRRVDFITGKSKNTFTHLFCHPLGEYKKTPEFSFGSFSKQWKSLNH